MHLPYPRVLKKNKAAFPKFENLYYKTNFKTSNCFFFLTIHKYKWKESDGRKKSTRSVFLYQ